jgi:hypothetical protein
MTNQEIIARQQEKIATLRMRLKAARDELQAVAFTDGLLENFSQPVCRRALQLSGGLPANAVRDYHKRLLGRIDEY